MTLLEEIEQGASSDDMTLGTLLRKCLMLGSRLGSKPTVDWVDWELNGYPSDVPVPAYRVLPLTIHASMNDITKRVTNWPVPPEFLGELRNEYTRYQYRGGIGAIEHALNKGNGLSLQIGNLVLYLTQLRFTHMEIDSAWGEVSGSELKHILDTVRTRVLKFVLDLAKEQPDAGTVRSTVAGAASKVDQIFINNIYGSANVIGKAQDTNVVLNVARGDFTSLKQTLEENGVSTNDIMELKRALDAEPVAGTTGFGPKVSTWVSKMMKKVAEGAWNIAIDVAGGLLGRALGSYYGLPER